MPPRIVSQGGYACGCAVCVRGARERALGARAVAHTVTHSFSARGVMARRSPSAQRGDGRTPLLCPLSAQGGSIGGRRKAEASRNGTTARTAHVLVRAQCVSRASALCCASLRVACHVCRTPPWIVGQGGYARGCAAWRTCAHGCRSAACSRLRAVVDVVTRSFSARGEIARRSPSAEHGHRRSPTLRVDTHPPQEGPTYTHTPQSLLPLCHQPFRGAMHTKDPGAPPLNAVYVCPSPWQPLGSGTAKSTTTQGLPARRKNHVANACCKSLLPASPRSQDTESHL